MEHQVRCPLLSRYEGECTCRSELRESSLFTFGIEDSTYRTLCSASFYNSCLYYSGINPIKHQDQTVWRVIVKDGLNRDINKGLVLATLHCEALDKAKRNWPELNDSAFSVVVADNSTIVWKS